MALALAVASLVLTTVHVSEHRSYSQFDEYVYIDYYARVLDHGLLREGSYTEDFARRYISCHVNRVYGPWQPQLCPRNKERPAAQYPIGGLTTADLYSPVFFYIIRVAAQPLIWSGVDFVQAGRYATSLWLVLAVILLYAGLRRMGANVALGAVGCLLMVSSVGAYFASTYISTDATALPTGAAMLLLARLYLDRPRRGLRAAILVVAALAGLLKIQNLEPVAVLALLLLFAAIGATRGQPTRERWRGVLRDHRTATGVAAVMLAGFAQVVWLVIRARLAVGPGADFGISRNYHSTDLVSNLIAFMVSAPELGAATSTKLGIWALLSASTLGLLISAGVLGLAFAEHTRSAERRLSWSVLIASVASGPVLSAATVVATGSYVAIAERYGLALLPAMLACVVFLVPQRSRVVNVVGLLVAVGFYAAALSFVG